MVGSSSLWIGFKVSTGHQSSGRKEEQQAVLIFSRSHMEGFYVIVNPEGRGTVSRVENTRVFPVREFWNSGTESVISRMRDDASCVWVRLLLFCLFLPGIIGESVYNDNNKFLSAFMVEMTGL